MTSFDSLRDEAQRARDSLRASSNRPRQDPAPPFPMEVLPPGIAAYINDAAVSLSCPAEMVAGPMLALAGGLIGNRLNIELKSSWREYPTLFLAVVAPPGSAKTPALNAAQWPIDALQDAAEKTYRNERDQYEDDLATWKQNGSGEKPKPPRLRHYFTTNPTLEAFVGMIEHSPGISIIRDEMMGWVNSMDQYKGGKGSDRQEYLSLWSCRTIKVDRKGSDPIYRRFPVASIVGGIQPDLAGGFHTAAKQRDGLIERLCTLVPDCEPAPWTDNSISPGRYSDILGIFRELDDTLDKLQRQAITDAASATTSTGKVAVGTAVRLSSDARAAWIAWFNANSALIGQAQGLASGFYSKLPTHVARFALILHALRNPLAPDLLLSGETMEHAIQLGEYFRVHIGRFLTLIGASAPQKDAGISARILRILRTPESNAEDGWVARSHILDRLRNVSGADLGEALDALEADGRIERCSIPGATKPTERWRLLPDPNHTPHSDYSVYSDYPGQEGRKSEYSEYTEHAPSRNGHHPEVMDAEFVELVV